MQLFIWQHKEWKYTFCKIIVVDDRYDLRCTNLYSIQRSMLSTVKLISDMSFRNDFIYLNLADLLVTSALWLIEHVVENANVRNEDERFIRITLTLRHKAIHLFTTHSPVHNMVSQFSVSSLCSFQSQIVAFAIREANIKCHQIASNSLIFQAFVSFVGDTPLKCHYHRPPDGYFISDPTPTSSQKPISSNIYSTEGLLLFTHFKAIFRGAL